MRLHRTIAGLGFLVLLGCGPSAPPKTVETPDPSLGNTPGNSGAPAADPGGGSGGAATTEEISRGNAAVKAGDWKAARTAFEQAIKKNPKSAEGYFYLGLVMDKTGDKAAAEQSYTAALDLQPDLQEAAENLTAVYVEGQKFDEAIALGKKALAKNPKSAELQLNVAFALSGKGDVDGANKAFDDAIKLSPNDPRFYIGYAQHLGAAKKNDQAIAKLKEAQRLAEGDPALLGTVGFAFHELRAAPECIAAMDKAIALKDNADFRTIRATCKYAKDRPGALADLQAATTKDPSYAPAHYWLGSMLHEDGKFDQAVGEYDLFLKAAPKGPMAKRAEDKMKLAKDKKKPEKPTPKK